MTKKLVIFEANKQDGIMSRNKKFYPEEVSTDQINERFLETRNKLGKKYNFNGKRIVQAKQKSEINQLEYPDGKYINLSKVTFLEDDWWDTYLPADILIFTQDNTEIVVGNQMADCPVIIAEDKRLGVTAVSHCGVVYINRELPKQTIEALIKEYHSNPQDIYVYVGSCAKKETFIYESFPVWNTNDKVWNGFIKEQDGKYTIDLVGAIEKQLRQLGVSKIEISPIDTITDPNYASYYGNYHGNSSKLGQNFVGCFYKDE